MSKHSIIKTAVINGGGTGLDPEGDARMIIVIGKLLLQPGTTAQDIENPT